MFTFENSRYNRQIQMPEWGSINQEKISKAKVVVIGAGGVKSSLLFSLVAAGVGHIRIIDFDKVDISNLNRQILYTTRDVGKYKSEQSKKRLQALNPEIKIESIVEEVNSKNIGSLCDDFDFVVEGGGSPAARNLVNKYCLKNKKPFTHASAQFGYGYVFSVIPELKTACFACFFPDDHTRKKHTGAVPVNVLPTMIAGALGAAEVIKYFMGNYKFMFLNKKLCFSSLLLSSEFSVEQRKRILDCPICSRYY